MTARQKRGRVARRELAQADGAFDPVALLGIGRQHAGRQPIQLDRTRVDRARVLLSDVRAGQRGDRTLSRASAQERDAAETRAKNADHREARGPPAR